MTRRPSSQATKTLWLLAPFAVVGLLTFAMLEVNRRKLLEQREHDLLENRGEIAGLVVALLRRDWVCRLDETTVRAVDAG